MKGFNFNDPVLLNELLDIDGNSFILFSLMYGFRGKNFYSRPSKKDLEYIINVTQNTLDNYDYVDNYIKNRNKDLEKSIGDVRFIKPDCNINNPKPGLVYIAKCNTTKFYKIGFTTSLDSRINTLQLSNPTIELLDSFSVPSIKYEKKAHKIFKDKKVKGEWFDLSKNDIENLICFLNKNSFKKDKK